MTNELLRDALATATVTPTALAQAVKVHPKTVGRWLADSAMVPHPVHRHAVARALGVREDVLWPATIRRVVKTGGDREIVETYAYRSLCPRSLWSDLIDNATADIWLAGYTNYFLWLEHPRFTDTLRRKAEQGCRIRILLGDPESDTTRQREAVEGVALTVSTRIRMTLESMAPLRGLPNLEARYSDGHISLSVFRFDADLIVTPHLANLVGHDSPTLHLHRREDDGLYDRFISHVTACWNTGRPVWPEPAQD